MSLCTECITKIYSVLFAPTLCHTHRHTDTQTGNNKQERNSHVTHTQHAKTHPSMTVHVCSRFHN